MTKRCLFTNGAYFSRPKLRVLLAFILLLGASPKAFSQYCSTPALDCSDDDMVQSFTMAGVTNTPSCNTSSGYNNYTTSVTTRNMVVGSANLLSVTVGYVDDEVGLWIDYNHNNTFDASEFTYVGYASVSGDVLAATVNIPAGAMTGPTRMRMLTYYYSVIYSTDACGPNFSFGDFGNVDDYSVNITLPVPPSCVATPTAPANASTTACAGSTLLSWPAAPGATGYDVYLNAGTGFPTTLVSANQTTTTYTATTSPGPYIWAVVPKNTYGAATGCATWTFNAQPTVAPTVSILASPGNNVCVGTSVTYTATTTNGGTTPSFQWKRNTVNSGTNATTFTPTTLNNNDSVWVVMTSNAVCATPATLTSNMVHMSVVARPTATITAAVTSVCQGENAALTANTGAGLTYQWLLNDAAIPGATTATYEASTSGDYQVAVSNSTCTDTSMITPIEVKPLPTATLTLSGPTTFCQNSSLSIYAPATTGYTYQWLSGGLPITGENNSSFTTTSAGSYSVVITSNGCTSTSAVTSTTLLPIPTATLTASGPVSFCAPGVVTLSANAGTGLTYLWQLNGSPVLPTTTTRTFTASTSGNYTVRVTGSNGCSTISAPATVTASTLPSAAVTVTGSTIFCQNSSVSLRAALVNGYTYQWYRNGVAIAGAVNYIYAATASGSYYAVITNGACVTTTTSTSVTVNPLPVATATAMGAAAFCEGGSVNIAANTGTGLSYQWRRNSAPIAGATTPNYNATQSGAYQVVVSNGICPATSASVNVVVSTMPVTTVTALGATTFCQNASVTMQATNNINYFYQWLKNGVDIPGATAALYNVNANGSYAVRITNGTCVGTSTAQVVTVTPGPATAVTTVGALNFCQGGSVTLNATRGASYAYQWMKDGVAMAGKNTSSIIANASGSYTVHISDGVCDSNSAPVIVSVNAIPTVVITVSGGNILSASGSFAGYQWYRNGVVIPNATSATYTATTDGFYAVVVSDAIGCSATSAVQHITSLDINSTTKTELVKIYPNPALSVVQIEAPLPIDVTLSTVDGRIVVSKESATTLDLTSFAAGVYLIRVNDHETGALIKTEKLVKGVQ